MDNPGPQPRILIVEASRMVRAMIVKNIRDQYEFREEADGEAPRRADHVGVSLFDLVARLATKGGLPQRDAKAVAEVVTSNASLIDAGTMKMKGAEAAQGPTIDFVGIEFLARGRLAANTVGRVVFRSGRAQGSGFLVGPGLFLTNNHVVSSAEMAPT